MFVQSDDNNQKPEQVLLKNKYKNHQNHFNRAYLNIFLLRNYFQVTYMASNCNKSFYLSRFLDDTPDANRLPALQPEPLKLNPFLCHPDGQVYPISNRFEPSDPGPFGSNGFYSKMNYLPTDRLLANAAEIHLKPYDDRYAHFQIPIVYNSKIAMHTFGSTTYDSQRKLCAYGKKKPRILFSQWQINELEKLFVKQKYISTSERNITATKLKLKPNQVKIWFQNRRYKTKKHEEFMKCKLHTLVLLMMSPSDN
jgi:hypothetical protein